MRGLFYLLGVALAAYAGYSGLPWYFILIASLIMVIDYFIIKAPKKSETTADQSVLDKVKIFVTLSAIYSIVTGFIYFLTGLLN